MAIISAHVYALQCYEYSCKSAFEAFEPNQCIYSSISDESFNLSLSLSVCTDLYFSYCPPVLENATCQLPPQAPVVNTSYIGDPCFLDENCIDSICINSTCIGLSANSPCTSDTQCNVGLYCDKTCVPQVGLGQNCLRDEGCLNNLTCLSGKCSSYLSIQPYSPVDICEDLVNFQCSSGGCFTNNGVNYCLPVVKSSSKGAGYCLNDENCAVSLNDGKITSYNTQCKCSQNGYATMTCSLATGDSIFVNYIKQLNNWLNSKQISSCHTTQRMSLDCIKSRWDYKNYITFAYFQEYALNYTTYKYSDSCVQSIYQSNFKSLSEAYELLYSSSSDSNDFSQILTILPIFILVN